MIYSAEKIRNICLLGHSGSGKTSLAESMSFITGASDRLGNIADGNTISDYTSEEIKRKISISMSVLPIFHKDHKLNIMDTPGNFDFAGEIASALSVCDSAVLVCSARDGLSIGAERNYKLLSTKKKPRLIYISRANEENSDLKNTLSALQTAFGSSILPIVYPIINDNKTVTSFVDLVDMKAYDYNGEIPIPAELASEIEESRMTLMESAASSDESLLDKYLEAGELSAEDIKKGLATGVAECSITPVLCGDAVGGFGTKRLLSSLIDLMPNPLQAPPIEAVDDQGDSVAVSCDSNKPFCAYVFKTLSDQYGKFSFVKVMCGTLSAEASLCLTSSKSTEKLGRLYQMNGKKHDEVKQIVSGDIGAISKMEKLKTSSTLCDPKHIVKLPPIPFAQPCYSKAIQAKVRGQEEKITSGLTSLREEDPSFTIEHNTQTHQLVIAGAGDIHLDVLVNRLKIRNGVEAELVPARIAYCEKIKKAFNAHGRHKKQSGGSGQFGDVWIRFEPQDESDDLIFNEEVFGGSVPKNYFPAVEKGLRDSIKHGVLAGYPMLGLKATLYDGSYHPVDSNEMAFKTAAQIAYKEGIPNASPTILEPIGTLQVTIPDNYLGDVMGDLNKRRGRVLGMNPTADGDQILDAEVPMAEMSDYAIDLRSITQSRGFFTFQFVRYEEAPPAAQQKAIDAAKQCK